MQQITTPIVLYIESDMAPVNKILIPLGLCMSIIIPVVVKSLVTDPGSSNGYEVSANDYLQPYRLAPESPLEMPGKSKNKPIELKPSSTSSALGPSSRNVPERSYLDLDRSMEIDPQPKKLSRTTELELILEASRIRENIE